MAIYDTSDQRLAFQAFQRMREKREELKAKKAAAARSFGVNTWKLYEQAQQGEHARRLDMLTPKDEKIFQTSPEYSKKGFLRKYLTPAGGRTELTEAGEAYRQSGEGMIFEGAQKKREMIELGKTSPEKFLGREDSILQESIAPEISRTEYREAGKALTEKGTDILKLTETGPTTIGEQAKSFWKGDSGTQWGKMGTLGKGLGVAGSILGGAELIKNWDEMSGAQKAGGAGALGLGIASMFIPGLGIPSLLAGWGKGLLD